MNNDRRPNAGQGAPRPTAALDDFLPAYRHRERHATQIAAPQEAVWRALHSVSGGELRLARVLMSVRSLPGRLPRGGVSAGGLPPARGFIETFMERGFRELQADPPWSLVAGAAAQSWRLRGGESADVVDLQGFRAFARPGFVLIATSFELAPLGGGTRLSTETRVQPTDAAAARAFRPYGWAIRGVDPQGRPRHCAPASRDGLRDLAARPAVRPRVRLWAGRP